MYLDVARRGGGAYNTYVSGYRVISYFAAQKGLEGSGTRKEETAAISWPSKGAVNGENLPICGQAEVSFQVGEYVGVYKVLVVKEMIQECLLGTDFLEKGDCVIDVKNKLLTIAGCTKPVHLFLGECAFTCHGMVHESTVIPAFHQVQLPVDLELAQEKRVPDSIGFFEPKPEFPDKHGGLYCLLTLCHRLVVERPQYSC